MSHWSPLGFLAKTDEVHVVVRGVAKELTLGGVVSIGHRRQVCLEDVLVGIGRQGHASASDSATSPSQ